MPVVLVRAFGCACVCEFSPLSWRGSAHTQRFIVYTLDPNVLHAFTILSRFEIKLKHRERLKKTNPSWENDKTEKELLSVLLVSAVHATIYSQSTSPRAIERSTPLCMCSAWHEYGKCAYKWIQDTPWDGKLQNSKSALCCRRCDAATRTDPMEVRSSNYVSKSVRRFRFMHCMHYTSEHEFELWIKFYDT